MDNVSEIKSRLNIEDVVGEYVVLKRSGRNFKGLSPFSNEKTPSFIVSPEKQIWHDFSSGRGGDMFSFIQEVEGLDFKESLDHLARKAGIELKTSTQNAGSTGQDKERLYQALDLATRFYQQQLTKNQVALNYVRQTRGFSKETIIAWHLGYAPNTGRALSSFLNTRGYSNSELISVGLISAKGYDMFRERLVIPLCDAVGKVVGFTARQLGTDTNSPKYINTPQTILYDKGRQVFGLHMAKQAIRNTKYVIVAEGNLDVISAHQAGTPQIVASAGTAMTTMHLKALQRFTGDIRLCFDSDRAGLAATERIIPLAYSVGVALSIISLPSGIKDPDELIQQQPKTWLECIQKPLYATDWLMQQYQNSLDLGTGSGKRQFSDVMLRMIRILPDQVEKDHYMQKLADIIGVSLQAITEKLADVNQTTIAPRLKRILPVVEARLPANEYQKFADRLLALQLSQPKLREIANLTKPNMFYSEQAVAVAQLLKDNPSFSGEPKQLKSLHQYSNYVKMLTLIFDELYTGLEPPELRSEVARLQTRVIEDYVKQEKTRLAQELEHATESQAAQLLVKVRKLDTLLGKSTRSV